MTVAELVESLKKLDQNMIVSVDGYEGGFTDRITIKELELLIDINKKTSWLGEHGLPEDVIAEWTKEGKKLEKRIVLSRKPY